MLKIETDTMSKYLEAPDMIDINSAALQHVIMDLSKSYTDEAGYVQKAYIEEVFA